MGEAWLDDVTKKYPGGQTKLSHAMGFDLRDATRSIWREYSTTKGCFYYYNRDVVGSLCSVLGVIPPHPFYLRLYAYAKGGNRGR